MLKETPAPWKAVSRGIGLSCVCSVLLWCMPLEAGFSPIEYDLRPDYRLVDLRPSGFNPKVSDLAWLSDGRLVVVHWADRKQVEVRQFEGRIYLLSGVRSANGPQDVTVRQFKSDMEDPVGVWVMGDTIYTVGGQYLLAHVDEDGDGSADVTNTLFDWGYEDKCRHEFFFGLVYQDGYFYTNASRCKDDPEAPSNPNTWQMHRGRGGFYKISKETGDAELIAGGLRSAFGLGVGPLGDIFQPDNQGNWLPSSKIIHPKKGRFYGFHALNFTPEEDYGSEYAGVEESPPAIWMPHAQASHSPGHPLLVNEGTFKGQMLVGDIAYGGIQRLFLEMVDGEWQGAAFNWTGGLEAGPSSLLWGPDGELYVGGIGIGAENNWGWHGTTTGLQKLVPVSNAPVLFEVLEVRSRSDGIEIVFTKPAGSAAGSASNYSVVRCRQVPAQGYGSGNCPSGTRANVAVNSATLSPDGRRAHLSLNMNTVRGGSTLEPNVVLTITLSSSIRSQDGNTIWGNNEAWYTLNSISESSAFDINGCTDPAYEEYNSEATFDDGTCRTAVTSVRKTRAFYPGIRENNGGIEVAISEGGRHAVEIYSTDGRLVERKSATGKQIHSFAVDQKGLYVVKLNVNGKTFTRKVPLF